MKDGEFTKLPSKKRARKRKSYTKTTLDAELGAVQKEIEKNKDRVQKARTKRRALKKAESVLKTGRGIVSEEELSLVPDVVSEEIKKQKVLFEPLVNPVTGRSVQREFLEAGEDEVLFSGGRGPLVYGEPVWHKGVSTPIEKVKIGDYVGTPEGLPAKVIDIPFDGLDDCYTFTLADDSYTSCGRDHIYPVYVNGVKKELPAHTITFLWEKSKNSQFCDIIEFIECGYQLREYKKQLVSVKDIGKQKVRCITLDSSSGLFITRDGIVTHNSGKSQALIVALLRPEYITNKNFRALVIRKTMRELKDLITKAKNIIFDAVPGAKWKTQENTFYFPSGATIEFGYCETQDDVERYRGREFCILAIDELTMIPTEEMYIALMSSVRTVDPTLPTQILSSTNPYGVGYNWVKKRFISLGAENTTIVVKHKNDFTGQTYVTTRKWLHSNFMDNPLIKDTYIASMAALPEEKRKRWMEGTWDGGDGMAFPEFDRAKHVIKPFAIPASWARFRACDWGYSTMAACLWFAVDPDDCIYVYREFTTSHMTADNFARKILELEKHEKIRYGVIDGSVGDKRGSTAPSIDEEMRKVGCIWRYADKTPGSRLAGKNLAHKYLAFDEGLGRPKLQIFDTCVELIDELSSLPTDENKPDDVDTDAVDHCFTEDTEILTDKGWKYFRDLDKTEKVATLSPDYNLEYQLPTKYITRDYSGEVVSYDSGISFEVTPEHQMCVVSQVDHKKWKTDRWQLRKVTDLDAMMLAPRTARWSGKKQDTLDIAGKVWDTKTFFWIMGMWLAEGCTRRPPNRHAIILDQKKHTDLIREKLASCPVPFSESLNKKTGCTRFYWQSRPIFDWFVEQGLAECYSDTKFIPRWMFDYDKEYLEELYEGMMLGDGSRTQNSWHYDTTSKQLADDFQELLLKIGRSGNLKAHDHAKKRNLKYKTKYRINIRTISDFSEINKCKFVHKQYSGKIYCVTVPLYHTIYVRRNGSPMWCGQCWDALRFGLLSRPRGRPALWDKPEYKQPPIVFNSTFGY